MASRAQSTHIKKFAVSCNISRKRWGINRIFCMKISIKVFCSLFHFYWSQPGIPNVPKIECLYYLCNISKTKGGMKLIFCIQINIELSYKLMPLIFMGMATPAKITWNNKFAKSLLYLKKEMRDEFVLLCRLVSQASINWYYRFWWGVTRHA